MKHYETTAQESELKKAAKETAEPLDRLIQPSDVQDGADSWDDVTEEALSREVGKCVNIIIREQHTPLYHHVRDLAWLYHRDGMTRAPMRHLDFDLPEKAVENGYWPYDMDKWEVIHELHDVKREPHRECIERAEEQARMALKPVILPSDV